jgi:hypothetical protein
LYGEATAEAIVRTAKPFFCESAAATEEDAEVRALNETEFL